MFDKLKFKNLYNRVNLLVNKNYWTRWLGLARSLLAVGLLITLSANSTETLFSFGINNEITPSFDSYSYFSIYNIIGDIEVATSVSIIILLFVISGIYPQVSCILHWWVTFSFFVTSFAIDGGDQLSAVLTFLLIPISITDKRKNHWNSPITIDHKSGILRKIIVFYAFLLISIQVAFVYFQAAVSKFQVPEWINGTALYYWFTHQVFGINEKIKFVILPVLENSFSITFLTWGVMLFELFLFSCFFIQNERVKKLAWIMGLLFHFGILIVHGLVSFFFAMAAALTLYLVARNEPESI